MSKGYLSSDTKAVLRELRRHDKELEAQVRLLKDAVISIDMALTEGVSRILLHQVPEPKGAD